MRSILNLSVDPPVDGHAASGAAAAVTVSAGAGALAGADPARYDADALLIDLAAVADPDLTHSSGLDPRELRGAVDAAVRVSARAVRVVGLHLGEARLRSELRVDPSPDDMELLWARSQIVLASAAAGIAAPVSSPYVDPTDLDALRCSTEVLRRLGFRGRVCTTAEEVAVVNDVFTVD